MALANVNLKFGVNLDSFRSSLQQVEKTLDRTGKKMQSIGQSMSLYISLPIAAIGAASIKAASDAEETFNKFDTVFRNIQGSAEKAFQTLRTEYGLSSTAAKQMLGDTGNLLTGFGFSQQGALELSMEVQKLAVDLASFTNYSGGAKGASEALTKALLGEREQLKSLGIAILEEDVKRQMALNSAKGMTFETERQAKAHATLQLAIQQSGNAIGDYARTSDSFANQSRLLRERLNDISVELGTVFLPLANRLVSAVTGVVEWFSKLDTGIKATIAIVVALVAAIGPLMAGLGFLMTSIIPMLKAGWLALTAVMTPLVLKIAAITAAVVGLIVVGKGVIDSWDTVKKFFVQMWDKVRLTFIQGVANTLKAFNKFTSVIGLDFTKTIEGMEKDAAGIKAALDAQPVITFGNVMSEIGNNIVKTFTGVKSMVSSTTEEVKNANSELANTPTIAPGGGGAAASGINRTADAGISGGERKNPFDMVLKIPESVKGISDKVGEASVLINEQAVALTASFNQIISDGIVSGLSTFGDGIGQLIAGTASIGDVGKMLLGTLGGVLNQLGQLAIGAGLAVEAIKTALNSLGGVGAIAAGIALIALSKIVTSKAQGLSKGGSGGGALGGPSSVPARAMGGSVQMGTPYLVGERGPELFTPSGFGSITNARNTAMGGATNTVHIVGQLVARGKDLVATFNEEVRIQGRST